MGHCNSAQHAQRWIDKMLRDIPNAHGYVNDIVIGSETVDDHEKHSYSVFHKLLDANTSLSSDEFPSIRVLGPMVDGFEFIPAANRMAALRNIKKPTNVSELESHLGLASACFRKLSSLFSARSLTSKENHL